VTTQGPGTVPCAGSLLYLERDPALHPELTAATAWFSVRPKRE